MSNRNPLSVLAKKLGRLGDKVGGVFSNEEIRVDVSSISFLQEICAEEHDTGLWGTGMDRGIGHCL